MFDKQVGELFASALAAQMRRHGGSAREVGRFVRLCDSTLDALAAAKEDSADAMKVLNEAVGGSDCRRSGRKSESWLIRRSGTPRRSGGKVHDAASPSLGHDLISG